MPHDLPHWKTVYGYFRRWVKTGLWKTLNLALARKVRHSEGRAEDPSLVMIDSQSVEMSQKGPAGAFELNSAGQSPTLLVHVRVNLTHGCNR